jgi:hypothetical protein
MQSPRGVPPGVIDLCVDWVMECMLGDCAPSCLFDSIMLLILSVTLLPCSLSRGSSMKWRGALVKVMLSTVAGDMVVWHKFSFTCFTGHQRRLSCGSDMLVPQPIGGLISLPHVEWCVVGLHCWRGPPLGFYLY